MAPERILALEYGAAREMVAISSDSWNAALQRFHQRTKRPLDLYSGERLRSRAPEFSTDLTSYVITRSTRPVLQSLAKTAKIPYYREMRIDELRAVILRLIGAIDG